MFTMARIKATRGKGKDFFLNHLACDDYYSEKERVIGHWKGTLAREFGLEGVEVGAQEFSLFQQNLNPLTGGKLTQRTVAGGIRFYDFQCSAQKSVSVMGLFDDRLAATHREAVAVGMKELERFAAVRLRKGENVHTQNHENTGKIVYAEFHHDASRALDPQLHTHNVVCNVTRDQDGVYKALENTEMCKAIRYCGRVYQNELARRCIVLGYEIENSFDFRGNFKGFEIKGVSENVLEEFSQRTREIDEQIAAKEQRLGRSLTAAEKHEISLDTRSRKMLESDAELVRKQQLERLGTEDLRTLETLAEKARGCKGVTHSLALPAAERRPRLTFEDILPEMFEHVSVLTQDKILAEALTQNLGKHSLEDWKQALARIEDLRNIGGEKHNPYLSPEAVIEAEKYAIEIVEQERGKFEPLSKNFAPFPDMTNRDAQRKIISGMLSSQNRFMSLRGVAGSGKTSTLQELCKGILSGGMHHITLLAPTNSAVDVLKSEGFGNAQTVASFILNHNDTPSKSVVIVDEAGLNSLREGVSLLKAAKQQDFRLIFVGDSRQHSAVENGDFFRLLENFSSIEKFSLIEIHRQQIADYKAGIQDCADGRFEAAFERFERNEYIHEARADYMSQAAKKYLEFTDGGKDLSQTIVVAPTHKECDELTAEIRQMIPLGKMVENPMVFRSERWSKAKLGNLKNYEPGQELMFVRKLKDVGAPGEMVTVENFEGKFLRLSNGKQLHISKAPDFLEVGKKHQIELKEDDLIQFKVNLRDRKIYNGNIARITDSPGIVQLLNQNMQPVKDGLRELTEGFGGFDYGWVTTSHKSQGRTANNVIVAAKRLDQKAFYVACSRGRCNLALFCPDKDYLRQNLLKNSSDRLTVHEVLERQYIGKIPAEPAKPHINLDEIRMRRQEWHEDFARQKSVHMERVAEYRHEKSARRAQIKELKGRLSELQSRQEGKRGEYKQAPPWRLSLWEKLKGKMADRHNAKIDQEIEKIRQEAMQIRSQIYSLEHNIERMSVPKFNMLPEPPLKFPERLAAWSKKVIRQAKSKLTDGDELLVRFANANTPDTFSAWWRNIHPTEAPDVQKMTWQIGQENPLIDLQKLQNLPKTEEQYKVFSRAKKTVLYRFRLYRDAALRRIRQEHDQRIREMERAVRHERQRFEAHLAIPDATPNQELWRNAFSNEQFSTYDWLYLNTVEAAKHNAHQRFIEDMKFDFVKESDLNRMEVPPKLTSDEIEQWLLSRTNAGDLNTLLEISCQRQQELQLEQQRREEQIRAEKEAEQQELKRFRELQEQPTATVDTKLWEKAFLVDSNQTRSYDRFVENARKNILPEFYRQMNFKYIKNVDLNPLVVPPKLRDLEIRRWLLSRTDVTVLNKLLQISCDRQHPQIEAYKRELARQEQERRRLESLPTIEQEKYLKKLVDYGCTLWISPEITRQQAAEVIAQFAPDQPIDDSTREFVRKKLAEYPDLYDYEPNYAKVTWEQFMGFKDELREYEQELVRQKLEQKRLELERERRNNPIADYQKRSLDNLVSEGRLDGYDPHIGYREANALYREVIKDDPICSMQKRTIQNLIFQGEIPYMTNSEIEKMTNGEYYELYEQTPEFRHLKEQNRPKAPPTPSKPKPRGMDL